MMFVIGLLTAATVLNYSAYRCIFTASDEFANEDKLWVSDGTQAGTQTLELVASDGAAQNPVNFADRDRGGNLYFSTQGGGGGYLWRTDGTQEGTQQVFDFGANGINAGVNYITAVGDRVFFSTGTAGVPGGLWVSDGTPVGTTLVTDGLEFRSQGSEGESIGIGDTLFFTGSDGTTGVELWKSDGTAAGSTLVRDIFPGNENTTLEDGANIRELTNYGGEVYFVADDGVNGEELWKSDGTEAGTTLVKDITIGEESSLIEDLTVVDGTLYLIANSEIWQSDGTEAGTFEVEPDSITLADGSLADEFGVVNELAEFDNTLYFSGNTTTAEGNFAPALFSLEDMNDTTGGTVYRLFNPEAGVHFYTTDEAERDNFVASDNYELEGESYTAVNPTVEGAEEVYRFFNETTGVHLYTTDETERENIQANLPEFTFEGTVFNAYPTPVEGSIPIYRFFEPTIGVHFYTPNEAERDSVEANLPNYNFEGIAYYALPLDADV